MAFVGACRSAPSAYRTTRCSSQFIAGSLSAYGHSIRIRGRKCEIEWTRLTMCKIVTSHLLAASLGMVLVVLGSMYSREAYHNKKTSVPLLLCILANVTGLILVSGTLALAKVTFAKLKQQRLAMAAAAAASGDTYCSDAMPLGPPPPYTAYGDPSGPYRDDQRQIYVDINIHPQTATTNIMISPPEYTSELPDYSDPPPPYQESLEAQLDAYEAQYGSRNAYFAHAPVYVHSRRLRGRFEHGRLYSGQRLQETSLLGSHDACIDACNTQAQVHGHRSLLNCRQRIECSSDVCHRLLRARTCTVRCVPTRMECNDDQSNCSSDSHSDSSLVSMDCSYCSQCGSVNAGRRTRRSHNAAGSIGGDDRRAINTNHQ